MRTNRSIGLLCGLSWSLVGVALLVATRPSGAWAQEPPETITVHLRSGRDFIAEVDRRTDAARLWLRSERDGILVRRPIRWDRIERVLVAGQEISGEQLRAIVEGVRQVTPLPDETPLPRDRIVLTGSSSSVEGDRSAIATTAQPSELSRVRSLAIDATVANWDADVEVDGLRVRVYPLDAAGRVVPVRGTLEVTLTGQRAGVVKRPWPFTRLGRWTRQIQSDDPSQSGMVYSLAFQGIHPEHDLSLLPYGAVHARLSVPGQGTFESTRSTVRIRPYSPTRDQLQQTTGRRFFPFEHPGR